MQDLIKSLHPLERKLLPFLEKKMGFRELVNKSKLKEIEVLRALNWLSVKNVLTVSEEVKEMIILDKHGKNAIENRLPEKRVVDVLTEELTLEQIKEKLSLTDNEINIALGILRRNKAITIINQKIALTPAGKKLQKKDLLPEEEFLRKLPMGKVKLTKEDEKIFDELKKRSQIKVDIQKLRRHINQRLGAGELDGATAERLNAAIDRRVQNLQNMGGTSSGLVHGDFHGGNVFLDGSEVTFIDVESALESLSASGDSAFINLGNDYGRFVDNLYHRGILNGLTPEEIGRLEDSFVTAYLETSRITEAEFRQSRNLYRAKTAVVAMKYAETPEELALAQQRLIGVLLEDESIQRVVNLNQNVVDGKLVEAVAE